MKRFHIHVSVNDLAKSIRFYSTLFGAEPSKVEADYAKWMLDDPRINFAISTHRQPVGVNHLGFQVDSADELRGMHAQLTAADARLIQEDEQACCYARSDKYWVTDPTGIAWETFHTLGNIPVYGDDTPVFDHGTSIVPTQSVEAASKTVCCVPTAKSEPEAKSVWLLRVAMSLQPTIRSGQGADLPAVLALLQGAGLPTADLTSAQALHLWVLEAEESLFGVIGMERFGACALLRSLAVAPSYRQRGLGHQLVARLERDAQADGVEQLVLLTETAEKFFRAIGYEVIDRRHVPEEIKQSAEFRSLCPASAVCMTKLLTSSRAAASHG